jgi:hypothetical protein
MYGQGPLEIDSTQMWAHRLSSPALIHSPTWSPSLHPDYVTLRVIIDAAGKVQSAQAKEGPAEFYNEAESLEAAQNFKPFQKNGVAVRASFLDYVSIGRRQTSLFPRSKTSILCGCVSSERAVSARVLNIQ